MEFAWSVVQFRKENAGIRRPERPGTGFFQRWQDMPVCGDEVVSLSAAVDARGDGHAIRLNLCGIALPALVGQTCSKRQGRTEQWC